MKKINILSTIFIVIIAIAFGYYYRNMHTKISHQHEQQLAQQNVISLPIESASVPQIKNSIDLDPFRQFHFTGDRTVGFKNLTQEIILDRLPIQGTIPEWLNGSILATGPAQFDLGSKSVNYWFDGFAMLHKFTFKNGSVSYRNKFLESTYYQQCTACGTIPDSFASASKQKSWLSRMASAFKTPDIYDNGNMNIIQLGSTFIATTETPTPIVFNPDSLKSRGILSWNDAVEGHLTTAQPHYDADTHLWYSFITNFANSSTYQLISINPETLQRTIVATLPVTKPAYMRSFSITKNYIILTEIPFVVRPLDLLLSARSFIENYTWEPTLGTVFTVINRSNGTVQGKYATEPFFMFNHINAHETKTGEIVVDIITYPDNGIIKKTLLNTLRSGNQLNLPESHAERFIINLQNKIIRAKLLSKDLMEFPTINPNYKQQQYRFIYGLGISDDHDFPNQILKLDIVTGQIKKWIENNCYPSQPIFVPTPQAHHEDDGVMISVVLNSAQQKSFLLILDAKTMKELTRAQLPHHIPFGLKGTFF